MAEVDFGVGMVCVLLPNYQKIVSDDLYEKLLHYHRIYSALQKYLSDSGGRRCNLYLPQMWYKINLH